MTSKNAVVIGAGFGFPRAEDFGRAMGICAGDITFFLAYDLLKRLDTAPETYSSLVY